MRSAPIYRIGAPISLVPRTKCEQCKRPSYELWLTRGKSVCTDCRRSILAPDEAA